MFTVSERPLKSAPGIRDRALQGLERLPPMSVSIGRLLSKLAFLNVSYADLSQCVEKDAVLCAHVLRVVNSAGFARARTITSVGQAMNMLGIGRLRRIAVGFTVANLFPRVKTPPSWSRQRFNLHSAAVAVLTEALIEELQVEQKDGAFVGGMLHDLGKLLIAVTLPEEYETIASLAMVSGRPAFDCESEALGTNHAELSGIALMKWGLPEVVCRSVFHHHTPDSKDAPLLATVIHRADRFVNHLGITVLPPAADVGDPPSLEIPGYPCNELAVLQRFETEWKELAAFFQ